MERILSILTDVFLTWQVLAVAVAFILFWGLIRYVANPRAKIKRPEQKRVARKKAAPVKPVQEAEASGELAEEEESDEEARPARRRRPS
jgi:hypothetical protein